MPYSGSFYGVNALLLVIYGVFEGDAGGFGTMGTDVFYVKTDKYRALGMAIFRDALIFTAQTSIERLLMIIKSFS